MRAMTTSVVCCIAAAAMSLSAAEQRGSTAPLLTVFAASDLGPAFKDIVPQFERKTGARVTLVLGSTGMLAQQIRNGAPADVFFAANESFVSALVAEKLTVPASTSLYARGRIVIVTLKSSGVRVDDLAELASGRLRRIAIANPQHAPYGLAAKQALEAAGIWRIVRPKLVYGENVQQAAQFVRSGSTDVGIVAQSVATMSDLNQTPIEQRMHDPLNQVAVVLARTKEPEASRAFIDFVNGPQGRAVMRQFGFLLPGESF
jgi:molybdate transport system substrate-binding protein